LNHDRKGQIPNARIELYKACCDTRIYRRDQNKGVTNLNYPKLSREQKYALLEPLAWWMMDSSSVVTYEEAIFCAGLSSHISVAAETPPATVYANPSPARTRARCKQASILGRALGAVQCLKA
jgi:hypothetical protein